jgi:methyl-accepting chemotaxis protein
MAKDRAEISEQISQTAEQLALLSGRLKTTVDKFQV